MISYRSANEVKASFDNIYQAPTPHAYFATMNELEYAIGQEARPFFHSPFFPSDSIAQNKPRSKGQRHTEATTVGSRSLAASRSGL